MSRALRFVSVGAGGFVVQALTLSALVAGGVPYPLATAVAVEAAILHNFLWHERWTWADRAPGKAGPKARGHERARDERLTRFVRFNGATAAISIAGNVALMRLFVGWLRMPLLAANLLAVLTLSVLNFVAADRFAFATKLAHRHGDPTPM